MAPIPLSAIDHMWTGNMSGPLQFVLRFDGLLDPEQLVAAYHETAAQYTGADGVLVRLDEHTLALDCDAPQPRIRATVADAEVPLEECVDEVVTAVGEPLARARVVTRGDHTVVGLSVSHGLADGYALFFFLAGWAARARGARFLTPNTDRTILTRPQHRVPGGVTAEELRNAGFVVVDPDLRLPERELFSSRIPSANFQAAEPDSKLSTADLVAATLFRDYAETQDVPVVTLACPVDIRRYVKELGATYFGNGFIQALLDVETDRVRAASVDEIAGWVRDTLAAVPDRIDSSITTIERFLRSPGPAALPNVWGYPPQSGFLVSNTSRIPMAWLDFGAGPPVTVATPGRRPKLHGVYVVPDPDPAYLQLVSTLDHAAVRSA